MKKVLCWMMVLGALVAQGNLPPEITNVRASQRADTKLVDIYYDAADADGDLLKIRVEISDNDGTTYSIPAFSLTGDIGDAIRVGTGKHIVWDAGTDWDGEYSDKMRVKVIAIDAKGLPGLEWGNEVPPGGFLLGQDGGAEGSGPSRHVSIPWSYWLSKYEITNAQYCEFLNAAFTTGIITQKETTAVYSTGLMPVSYGCGLNTELCPIGDDYGLRWNVNKFEPVDGKTNWPVNVTWYGAMAFARFYGYDLPTEAEWEKGARGPDNDDQDEHLVYPWGNEWSDAYANSFSDYRYFEAVGTYNGNQTPIGPDTINGYGLYDVIGNAAEWTRTLGSSTIESYPTTEALTDARQMFKFSNVGRIYKGLGADGIYARSSTYQANSGKGFRVVKRADGVKDVTIQCAVKEDFSGLAAREYGTSTTYKNNGYAWTVGKNLSVNVTDGKVALRQENNYGTTEGLCLPKMNAQILFVRVHVRNSSTSDTSLDLYSRVKAGDSYQSTGVTVSALSGYQYVDLSPVVVGDDNVLRFNSCEVDSVEIWTVVEPE